MPTALVNTNLFKPIKVGPVTLQNRLVYAPTTRYRNTDDFIATDSMLKYYQERAENNGGLLIVEATFPSEEFGLYANGPMLKSQRQIKAWKKIVQSVHEKGSAIAIQLWNLGRVADPELLKKYNLPLIAPSALYFDQNNEKQALEASNPVKAMTVDEIHKMVETYANCAKIAINDCKFDIVEVHAAHMYLLDQFLNDVSNKRTDQYGGSLENRARFILEVIDAMIDAVGAEHIAIRLSPYAQFQGGKGIDSPVNPIVTYGYVYSELERRAKQGKRLAYLSFVEPRVSGDNDNPNFPTVGTFWVNEIWKGIILRTGALLHDPEYKKLQEYVNGDDRTLIGAARYYTSNPDLAMRLKNGHPLTHYDRSTFYNRMSNKGYLGWAKFGKKNDAIDESIKPVPLA